MDLSRGGKSGRTPGVVRGERKSFLLTGSLFCTEYNGESGDFVAYGKLWYVCDGDSGGKRTPTIGVIHGICVKRVGRS